MENDRFIKVLERFVEVQEEILLELRALRTSPLTAKPQPNLLQDLIDSVDVKEELKISKSTLYRIKTSNLITPIKIGKRDYYSLTEIKKIAAYFMK